MSLRWRLDTSTSYSQVTLMDWHLVPFRFDCIGLLPLPQYQTKTKYRHISPSHFSASYGDNREIVLSLFYCLSLQVSFQSGLLFALTLKKTGLSYKLEPLRMLISKFTRKLITVPTETRSYYSFSCPAGLHGCGSYPVTLWASCIQVIQKLSTQNTCETQQMWHREYCAQCHRVPPARSNNLLSCNEKHTVPPSSNGFFFMSHPVNI